MALFSMSNLSSPLIFIDLCTKYLPKQTDAARFPVFTCQSNGQKVNWTGLDGQEEKTITIRK